MPYNLNHHPTLFLLLPMMFKKNTDHNDLIDSPDSLADEMGKLEGEIPFPPVPVNYYFVLLAISILIDFGNIFFLFFSWVDFWTNKKNLTWWSLHLLHVQARGWSRRTQWKVLTKVNKSAVDSLHPFSTISVADKMALVARDKKDGSICTRKKYGSSWQEGPSCTSGGVENNTFPKKFNP